MRRNQGTDAQRESVIVTVLRAEAELFGKLAASFGDDHVERGAEAVAVCGMQHVEPCRRRAVQIAFLQTEYVLEFRSDVNLVGGNVPVPDQIARTGDGERA